MLYYFHSSDDPLATYGTNTLRRSLSRWRTFKPNEASNMPTISSQVDSNQIGVVMSGEHEIRTPVEAVQFVVKQFVNGEHIVAVARAHQVRLYGFKRVMCYFEEGDVVL